MIIYLIASMDQEEKKKHIIPKSIMFFFFKVYLLETRLKDCDATMNFCICGDTFTPEQTLCISAAFK